jgi:hypothetical protein
MSASKPRTKEAGFLGPLDRPGRVSASSGRPAVTGRYHSDRLARFIRLLVEPGSRVLQIRSRQGDLLAATEPLYGVGLDPAEEAVREARRKYPRLRFDLHSLAGMEFSEPFDYVILDGLDGIADLHRLFLDLKPAVTRTTRLILLSYHSPRRSNRFDLPDIENLLTLSGFETLKRFHLFMLSARIPVLAFAFNGLLSRIPGVRRLCPLQALIARPLPGGVPVRASVSVIVPCKNERGNVEGAVRRIPSMGRHTEIIFCDDRSTDGTADEVRALQRMFPEKDIKLLTGPGVCKALNVWTGFDAAQGDVLMILDGDLTAPPEELPYFYEALVSGKGDFINGTRMIYRMQRGAMPASNNLGNRFFSLIFSVLLDQRTTDTLCGTKVLWRQDYERIRTFRGSWAVQDRWGDFELLLGAARLHLKIVEVPVHYLERIYGETKMTGRLRTTWTMLRMCAAGLARLRVA